jgi:hypothetical protein
MESYPRKSAFKEIKDAPPLDCPNNDCPGWLVWWGRHAYPKPIPVFFKCSRNCSQRTILSKMESDCSVCDARIKECDIITTGWDNISWVHFRCAHRSVPPPDVFAVCLRCKATIASFEDSVPSKLGSVDGFLHRGCTKKRYREDDRGHSSQSSSSQGSTNSQSSDYAV